MTKQHIDRSEIEALLAQHILLAYDMTKAAKDNADDELQEMTSHYIFDLLDWGRRTLQLSDDDIIKLQELKENNPSTKEVSIGHLESTLEAGLTSE